MFHRRHRSASATPNRYGTPVPAASSAAQSAAVQAFLANRPSSVNLSSAAAAAALRTMSPAPTPVHQVQTKRMLQRQISNSSTGSYPGLQRQSSSGSMTERTFRSPSPNRPGSKASRDQAPALPPMPQRYVSPLPLETQSDKRAVSLQPPPQITSPMIRNAAGRGASLEEAAAAPPRPNNQQRHSSLQNINELERSDSRSSMNFSYPGYARPNSPTPRQSGLMQSQWAPDRSRKGISPAQAAARISPAQAAARLSPGQASKIQQEVSDASRQPVKKKKKAAVAGAAQGSHLSSGSVNRPVVTPYEQGRPPRVESDYSDSGSQREFIKKPKKAIAPTPESSDIYARPMSPRYSSDEDSTPEKTRVRRAQRASGTLNKQPSIVREDSEGEREEASVSRDAGGVVPNGMSPVGAQVPAAKSGKQSVEKVLRNGDVLPPPTLERSEPVLAVNVPSPNIEMPLPTLQTKPEPKFLNVVKDDGHGPRQASLSPPQSTRFSHRLTSDLAGERKHEPLPRSVSPAKSAMKHHSPSPAPASPVDAMVPGAWKRYSQTPSEASDVSSMASVEGAVVTKKKKSVRVSFDDSAPEIVGTTASPLESETPALASPQDKDQAKKGWFGLRRTKPTSLGTIPAQDEMEDVMTPRPVLPSFGSVRKNRDTPEQRSSSATYSPIISPPATTASSAVTMPSSSDGSTASNPPTTDTSVSSDHAIGNVLAQEKAKPSYPFQNQALPLPPEVTSKESAQIALDDSDSVCSQEDAVESPTQPAIPAKTLARAQPEAPLELVTANHNVHEPAKSVAHEPVDSDTTKPAAVVPTISVEPATPHLDHEERDEYAVNLPGEFPDSTYLLAKDTVEAASAGLGLGELVADGKAPEARDSDGDSIYSDAAETASLQGDGFGSINAIMETPVVAAPAARATVPESPIVQNSDRPTSGARVESWDQTQAHWNEVAERQKKVAVQPQVVAAPVETIEESVTPKKKKSKFGTPILQDEIAPQVAANLANPPPKALSQKFTKFHIQDGELAPQVASELDSPPRATPQSSPYPPISNGLAAASQQAMRQARQPEAKSPQFPRSMREKTIVQPQVPRQSTTVPVSQPKTKGALQKKRIPSASGGGLAAADAVDNRAYGKQSKAQSKTPQPVPNESDSESSFRKQKKKGSSEGAKYSMRRSMRAPQEPILVPTQAAGRGGVRSASPINRRPFSEGGYGSMRSTMRGPDSSIRAQENHQRPASALSGFGRGKSKKLAAIAPPRALTSRLKSRFADSDDEGDARPATFQSRFQDSSDDEPEPIKFRPVRGIPRRGDEGDSTDLEDSSDEKDAEKAGLAGSTASANNPSSKNGVQPERLPLSPSSGKKRSFLSRFRSKKVTDEPPVPKVAMDSDKPTSPAAKRQAMPERVMSDSWPLPPKIMDNDGRPYTSDGVATTTDADGRPGVADGQNTSSTVKSAGGAPTYGRSGKKKRFQMLRKAFGLYD